MGLTRTSLDIERAHPVLRHHPARLSKGIRPVKTPLNSTTIQRGSCDAPSCEWIRAADRYVSEATLTLIRAPSDEELAAVVVMVKRLADEHRHRLSAH